MSDSEPKHFIVKHGLDSFELLPNYIWRTGKGPNDTPRGFKGVKLGDRWVGFAYTANDTQKKPLSKVTGFFECVQEARYDEIPPEGRSPSDEETRAWLIEGKRVGEQLVEPVDVPPINELLGRKTFAQAAIVPISGDEFAMIQEYTLRHQFDTSTIPVHVQEQIQ